MWLREARTAPPRRISSEANERGLLSRARRSRARIARARGLDLKGERNFATDHRREEIHAVCGAIQRSAGTEANLGSAAASWPSLIVDGVKGHRMCLAQHGQVAKDAKLAIPEILDPGALENQ